MWISVWRQMRSYEKTNLRVAVLYLTEGFAERFYKANVYWQLMFKLKLFKCDRKIRSYLNFVRSLSLYLLSSIRMWVTFLIRQKYVCSTISGHLAFPWYGTYFTKATTSSYFMPTKSPLNFLQTSYWFRLFDASKETIDQLKPLLRSPKNICEVKKGWRLKTILNFGWYVILFLTEAEGLFLILIAY